MSLARGIGDADDASKRGPSHLRTQFSSNKNKAVDEACPIIWKEGRKLLCCVDKVCWIATADLRSIQKLEAWDWEGIPSWKPGIVRADEEYRCRRREGIETVRSKRMDDDDFFFR